MKAWMAATIAGAALGMPGAAPVSAQSSVDLPEAVPAQGEGEDAYMPSIPAAEDTTYLAAIPAPDGIDPVSMEAAAIPVIEVTGTLPQIAPETRAPDGAPAERIDPVNDPSTRTAHLRAQLATFCVAIEQGCDDAPGNAANEGRAFTSGMDAVIDALRNYPRILTCDETSAGEERCGWE